MSRNYLSGSIGVVLFLCFLLLVEQSVVSNAQVSASILIAEIDTMECVPSVSMLDCVNSAIDSLFDCQIGDVPPCPLLMLHAGVVESSPLLTRIFFDSSSSGLPSRYHTLTVNAVRDFSESGIDGSLLDVYYHTLNVIAFRLKRMPYVKIEIVATESDPAVTGELPGLGLARANTVYRYLVDIWKVDSQQVEIGSRQNFRHFSSITPEGREMNRNVEIRIRDIALEDRASVDSLSNEFYSPVVRVRKRPVVFPTTMSLRIDNGAVDSLIDTRIIEIRQGGEVILERVQRGVDAISKLVALNYFNSRCIDMIAYGAKEIEIQVRVRLKNQKEYESNVLVTPVVYFDSNTVCAGRYPLTVFEAFLLYGFDQWDRIGPINSAVIRDRIRPLLDSRSIAIFECFVPEFGAQDRNYAVASQNLREALYFTKTAGEYRQTNVLSYLVSQPSSPYPNDLPEGRNLNFSIHVAVIYRK